MNYLGQRIHELCACRYPNVPLMALTATATPRVQHDVVQQLCLRDCVVFRSSFNRPNLRCAAFLPASCPLSVVRLSVCIQQHGLIHDLRRAALCSCAQLRNREEEEGVHR